MALEVIGAGFGRTGTMSLKVELETLGFGPCYHMSEVSTHPEHVEPWRAAAQRLLKPPPNRGPARREPSSAL
jgi:Sulfotransferase domain